MITQFGIFSGFYDVAEKNHCRVKHPKYDVFFFVSRIMLHNMKSIVRITAVNLSLKSWVLVCFGLLQVFGSQVMLITNLEEIS